MRRRMSNERGTGGAMLARRSIRMMSNEAGHHHIQKRAEANAQHNPMHTPVFRYPGDPRSRSTGSRARPLEILEPETFARCVCSICVYS
eukprot:9485908-Pyramimonas_sp.AAC.1